MAGEGESGQRYAAEVCKSLRNHDQVFIDAADWPPPLGLQKTQEIQTLLDELQQQQQEKPQFRLRGTYIRGLIVGPSIKLRNSVLTVLRDIHTPSLLALQVCFSVSSKTLKEDAERMYPPGTVVLLKEPLLAFVNRQRLDNSSPLLVVPSPADVELVAFCCDPETLVGLVDGGPKRLGNEFFKSGRYLHACMAYSDAAVHDQADRVTVLSNLAQSYLKMEMVDKAVLSACKALEIDPVHAKSLYRKSQGLLAMKEYVRALECLQLAASLQRESFPELEAEVERCKLLCEQSRTGVYHVFEFLCSGLNTELAPECADFVGPVVVKSGQHGRGLYLTEDVQRGQLLLVSNPIAALHERKASNEDLMVELVRVCRGSSKALAQLNALAHSHDNGDREVPDMDMFKPNVSWKPSEAEPQLDVRRMINTMNLSSSRPLTRPGKEFSFTPWDGVWGLPALINHSCLPTVSKTYVGRAVFVRAAGDLPAGEELVYSYTYSAAPWLEYRRQECYESWGFYCSCKRCQVEQKYEHLLKDIGFKFPRVSADPRIGCKFPRVSAEPRELVARLETALEGLPEGEKLVIRASYIHAYIGCTAEELESVSGCPTVVELMGIVHEVMTGTEASIKLLLKLAGRLPDETSAVVMKMANMIFVEEGLALYGAEYLKVAKEL